WPRTRATPVRQRRSARGRWTGGRPRRSPCFSRPSSATACWSVPIGTAPSGGAFSEGPRSSGVDAARTRRCSGWATTACPGRSAAGRGGGEAAPGAVKRLPPEGPAGEPLASREQAETAPPPTQALYALRASCRKVLRDPAAQADSLLAEQTPPTIALDHYLRG